MHFYKDTQKNQIKVGIFVVVFLLIFFFSYGWLIDLFSSGKQQTIHVIFENASSIRRGDSVIYKGIRIGRVNSVNLIENGVLMTITMSEDIKLYSNTLFMIKDQDFLGSKVIEVIYPKIPNLSPIDKNTLFHGTVASGLSNLLSTINNIALRFESFIDNLNINDDLLGNIEKLLTSADNTFSNLSDLFTSFEIQDISILIIELKNTNKLISDLITNNSESLIQTHTRIDSLLIHSTGLVQTLQTNINNEESNLNRLLNDKELYESLVKTATEMKTLLEDIRKNPRKYFNFSLF